MKGIEYLKEYCQKLNINPDDYFKLGRGTQHPDKVKKRYELNVDTSRLSDTQLYAIQYCKDIEVYIAWDVKRPRHPFSLKESEIIMPLGDKVRSVKKAVQFSGWGEELVLYFSQEGIPDFIERYVKRKSA